jgi:transposase
LSEQRTYRQFTPEQKAEIVLAGLRGDRSACGEHQIAETLYYQRREQLLEGGKTALSNPRDKTAEQTEIDQLRRKVGQLERAFGRKTYELEVAGELSRECRGLGVRVPVARSRAVV